MLCITLIVQVKNWIKGWEIFNLLTFGLFQYPVSIFLTSEKLKKGQLPLFLFFSSDYRELRFDTIKSLIDLFAISKFLVNIFLGQGYLTQFYIVYVYHIFRLILSPTELIDFEHDYFCYRITIEISWKCFAIHG